MLLEWADDPSNVDSFWKDHPNSYLQWVPSKTLDSIGWDGNEKFYDYVKWLQFVCDWLIGAGISANGNLFWSGEDTEDIGILSVTHNQVTKKPNQQNNIDFTPIELSDLAEIALEQLTQ